jgi:hypothetical protein
MSRTGPIVRISKRNARDFRLYGLETFMALFSKLFSRKTQPAQRVRVCVECGMPVAEHKDWCSIFRTQQEMASKAATK